MEKRDTVFDFLKGIAILVVMYIHAQGAWNYISWDLYVPVGSFNFNSWFLIRQTTVAVIPVFFFISGYFTSQKPALIYCRSRVRRIVLPFLIWSGIYTLVNAVVYRQTVTLSSFLLGTNAIHLYFLAVMIQFMVLAPLLTSAKNRKRMLAVCIAVTFANDLYHLAFWIRNHEIVTNELLLCTGFIAYYYFGFYLRNEVDIDKLNTPKIRRTLLILLAAAYCLLLISACLLLNATGSVPVATSFNNPLNLLYSIAVILCLMAFKNRYRSGPLKRKIEWVGLMSIDFYAVHWLIMYPIELWELKTVPHGYMWLINIGMVAVTFLCSYVFAAAKLKAAAKFKKESVL